LVHDETSSSEFVIDTREATDVHPGWISDAFNNMLPNEAAMNAMRNLKKPEQHEASSGHTTTRGAHLDVCMTHTTDTYKWTWGVTMSLDEMNKRGHRERHMRQVMPHEFFAPMTGPRMADTTVDLKLRYKKNWVSHLVLKRHQGKVSTIPETLAVQEEVLEMMAADGDVDPDDIDLQIVVYKGLKATAYAFGPGTTSRSTDIRSMVFKFSDPGVHFECMRVLKEGKLTMGMDGDTATFIFNDHTKGIDLRGLHLQGGLTTGPDLHGPDLRAGGPRSAPSDWVLIADPRREARWTGEAALQNQARVEGLDQRFDPAQRWTGPLPEDEPGARLTNESRSTSLTDLRLPNENRSESGHLMRENPDENPYADSTLGPAAMEPALANQASLALPDRPGGLAEEQDIVQAQTPGSSSGSISAPNERPENVLLLPQPDDPTRFAGQHQDEEKEKILEPTSIPAETVTAVHPQEVRSKSWRI
jgi:hypothetical protein